MKRNRRCCSCGSGELWPFLSLGRLPLASMVRLEQLSQPEERGSLELAFCPHCGLVQRMGELDQEVDRPSVPGQAGLLERLLGAHRLDAQPLVLALGGSSLELLGQLMWAGLRVVYLEPQTEQARLASSKGIPTRFGALDRAQAQRLREEGLRADLVLVGQELAFHPRLNEWMGNLALVLKEQGQVVAELPYLGDLLEARQFNRFTFQQANYLSLGALQHLAQRHGLWLQEVEPLARGYLRCYLGQARQVGSSVGGYLEEEQRRGLGEATTYLEFASQVAAVREALLALLSELRARGRRIAAFGTQAPAAILLNYVGLGREVIDFVIAEDPGAAGGFIAGVHLPIYGGQKLLEAQPDYLLLLDHSPAEVARLYPDYLGRGGKFIVALPYPDILRGPTALGRPHGSLDR